MKYGNDYVFLRFSRLHAKEAFEVIGIRAAVFLRRMDARDVAAVQMMRDNGQDRQKKMGFVAAANRLETASMTGFRRGMSCSNVIGHKLGIMYGVSAETPSSMSSLVGAIEGRLSRRQM